MPPRRSPSTSPPGPPQAPTQDHPPADEEGSASSSTAFSGAADFVEDPGPAFDPESSPTAPLLEDPDEIAELDEGWREETVRDLLVTQGEVTHYLLRVGDHDEDTWEHTAKDLRRIAPPLTRMLNRYDITRAAAAAGDEAALAAALSVYVSRNYTKRRRMIAELRERQPVPITGVAADPDLGPDFDDDYRRRSEPPPALRPKGARR